MRTKTSFLIYTAWASIVFAITLALLMAFAPRPGDQPPPWPTACAPDGTCALATETPRPTWLPATAEAVQSGRATYQASVSPATAEALTGGAAP